MLGIGFIIAHFVAMQKPQQRKYHSSCNRSVHRGTAHRKQRVKVCKRKTPHLFLMRSFLSPCGDKCNLHKTWNVRDQTELPSPYGDKLQSERRKLDMTAMERFPSPCGDKLQCLRMRMYHETFYTFPSPCGDKLQFDVFPLDESCFPFPSPCGELIGYQEAWADYRWFPSPYGV